MDHRSDPTPSASPAVSPWLSVYLRNHAAAARGGVDLFDRAARGQAHRPWAPELAALATQVREDCDALGEIVRAWGVRPAPWLAVAVRAAERVGRLKPNGRLVRRSPLADLVEVEAGLDAVHAKAAGWQALRAARTPPSPVDLDDLVRRAEDQLTRLRDLHRRVAATTL